VFRAEGALQHPVHHRREPLPGDPRRATVALDQDPSDGRVVGVAERDVRENEDLPAALSAPLDP